MPALTMSPSAVRDAQGLTAPAFGGLAAEDPCQILGDPWNGRDNAASARHDDRPGIHPFARLTRRKH